MIAVELNSRANIDETVESSPRLETDAGRVARASKDGRTGWIGIDLGSRFLKIAQIVSDGGGLRINTAEIIEVPQSDRESGDDPAGLVSSISDVLRSADVLGNSVACLLPKSAYAQEHVELPSCDSALIENSIRQHLNRRNARTLGDSSIDFWKIPGRDVPGEKADDGFQVISVQNNLVESIVQGLHKSGYRVRCVDGPMMAAARAVELDDPTSLDRNVAVIDWGCSTATYTLVLQGVPVFVRSLRDSHYGRIVGAVSEGLGIGGIDADVLLRRYGLPDVDEPRPADEIRKAILTHILPSLRVVREELERTVNYTNKKLSLAKPDRLMLTGGGALVGKLSVWLQRQTGIETSCWSPARLKPNHCRSHSMSAFANAMALSALSFTRFRQ